MPFGDIGTTLFYLEASLGGGATPLSKAAFRWKSVVPISPNGTYELRARISEIPFGEVDHISVLLKASLGGGVTPLSKAASGGDS